MCHCIVMGYDLRHMIRVIFERGEKLEVMWEKEKGKRGKKRLGREYVYTKRFPPTDMQQKVMNCAVMYAMCS